MNVFAYTPAADAHPPYLSINEDDDGKVKVSARQGPADNFKIVEIEMPFEEIEAMHRNLGVFIDRRKAG